MCIIIVHHICIRILLNLKVDHLQISSIIRCCSFRCNVNYVCLYGNNICLICNLFILMKNFYDLIWSILKSIYHCIHLILWYAYLLRIVTSVCVLSGLMMHKLRFYISSIMGGQQSTRSLTWFQKNILIRFLSRIHFMPTIPIKIVKRLQK